MLNQAKQAHISSFIDDNASDHIYETTARFAQSPMTVSSSLLLINKRVEKNQIDGGIVRIDSRIVLAWKKLYQWTAVLLGGKAVQ